MFVLIGSLLRVLKHREAHATHIDRRVLGGVDFDRGWKVVRAEMTRRGVAASRSWNIVDWMLLIVNIKAIEGYQKDWTVLYYKAAHL